ncbi:MAG: copper chaperone PCu(A)C [Rhodobiaceae bacterium]|nr:copper chaperone PCu(A)C [Rhodobiaceae bacterium]
MKAIITRALVALVVVACAGFAAAPALAADTIKIENAWTRATPPGAAAGGGFLTITNTGPEDDTLVGGSAPGVGKTEIHMMEVKDGIMKMAPVPGGLTIPAGETVTLKPGSYHVMFMKLDKPFVEGEMLDATLTFAKAGDMPVHFMIDKVGVKEPTMMHKHSGN